MHNAKYVTIKENGTFVGGKPTNVYQKFNMVSMDIPELRKYIFNKIQQRMAGRGLNVAEVHIIASSTEQEIVNGKPRAVGNPSSKPGPNLWYRVKTKNGKETNWRFVMKHTGPVVSTRVYACFDQLAGGVSLHEVSMVLDPKYELKQAKLLRKEIRKFARNQIYLPFLSRKMSVR